MSHDRLPLLVSLAVELVEDLLADVLDLANVPVVVVLGDIGAGHLTNVLVKALNGLGDVVQHPAAKEGSDAHQRIEDELRVHALPFELDRLKVEATAR